jgi:hopanoid biosynthesis associated RND transporter like protein HpnN
MLDRWRHKLLGRWAHLVADHPRKVLAVALAGALVSVVYAAVSLTFQGNRNELISEDLAWNQRFIAWRQAFPGTSDLYVLADTQAPGGTRNPQTIAAARTLMDELGATLEEEPAVEQAVWRYRTDPDSVHPRAIRVLSLAEFEAELARLRRAEPVLRSETAAALLDQAAASPAAMADDPQAVTDGLRTLTALIEGFTARLTTPPERRIDLHQRVAAASGQSGWSYLATENQRLLIMRIRPRADPDAISPYAASIRQIRRHLDQAEQRFPSVPFGLTGIEAIEADETSATTRDSTIASILAAVLIAGLLIAAFHSVRAPLLLMTTLLIAIAWSFGFLTLFIGHLQVISVVFTVILLGLGVAFGIHLVSRYELVRHRFPDDADGFAEALRDTLEVMGPGLLTGAITTSAAFCTTLLTDFVGVAEMGLIAAAGIMLCLLAMVSVFPALLRLFKADHGHLVRMEDRFIHFFEERWAMPFVRWPWTTVLLAALLMVGAVLAAGQVRFDYNLMKLLPAGAQSVVWQQKAVRQGDQSVYYGVSVVDDMAEARRLSQRLRMLDTVEGLGGVGTLIPPDDAAKRQRLDAVRQQLQPALDEAIDASEDAATETPPALLPKLTALRLALRLGRERLPEAARPAADAVTRAIKQYAAAHASLNAEQREARLAALQRDFTRFRRQTAELIQATLDTSPLQLTDLPAEVMSPYIGTAPDGSQRLAIEIYPDVPDAVGDPLDPRFLNTFINQLKASDAQITGVIVQIYESGTLIWTAYLKAGGYALIAVFILLMIDFRSLRDALLCLFPVGLGFGATFAVLVITGVGVNPANIIVLPLMFGIGVDDGVHIIHRYRQDRLSRPLGLTAGTGKGIALTSYTTIIGFGSLLIADHRGIASLGLTLAMGVGFTLLACWTLMPAWLELRERHARP